MSLAIRGMGWVTPLGNSVSGVWEKLLSGEEAAAETIQNPISSQIYQVFRVPQGQADHPRLRRSSLISRFAVAAGLAALHEADINLNTDADRIALVFATSNGGVIYTKRFYHDIVTSGAQAASPLLFPETVFNAPASHLAAILGITGATYTLVADGAVGVLALNMAEDLMQNDAFNYCLVVGAEEVDWLLCDAYRKWRLLRRAPPIEPFHEPPKGMILSEGAGAVVLAREGGIQIERVAGGGNYLRRKRAAEILSAVFTELGTNETDIVIGCANGTFVDFAERDAALAILTKPLFYSMKPALGESVGASAFWQIIVAAQVLQTRQVPPQLHAATQGALQFSTGQTVGSAIQRATVSTCGLNQQAGGLRLSIGVKEGQSGATGTAHLDQDRF